VFGLSQDRLTKLRSACSQSGDKGYWRKILVFCQEASFASSSGYGWCDYLQNLDLAAVQARVGEFDAAFESIERAYAMHEAEPIYLNVDHA